jgi:DNA-binding NarL/FixJ family response regulator
MSARTRRIRIAVRSDRRLYRDAVVTCLAGQPDCHVIGNVGHLDDLVSLCQLCRPDVALVDIGVGAEDLGPLRACAAATKVVVLYEHLSPAGFAALSGLGVDTLMPYSHGMQTLLMVLRHRFGGERDGGTAAAGITEREQEIISLVGAGHTVNQIASLMAISPSAVALTKRRIYYKLHVASQGEAVARATVLGIAAPSPQRHGTGRAGSVFVVLRGAAGPAWGAVTAALVAGDVAFVVGQGAKDCSVVLLVDPARKDWPTGWEAGLPVLLVRTTPPQRAEALDALLRGACGVLTADQVATALLPALLLATDGHVTVEAGTARDLLATVRAASGARLPELTGRELDILRSIELGHTVRQTARTLGIAVKTVENTQSRLFRKLNARNRAGALVTAHGLGLLQR